MKKTLTTVIAFTFLAAIGYAAPAWDTITDVAPDAPANAEWNDFTDFVPDMDVSPDGWLYLKLWQDGGWAVPWDMSLANDAQGRTYVFRAPADLDPGDYDTAWEQVLRFAANSEAGAKVSLAKRGGAFHGANFAARWDIGGGWDWSFMSYYVTNEFGQPVIRATDNDAPDYIYAPGNKHPYAVSQIAGFAMFDSVSNYVAITSSGDNTGDSIANIEGRKVGGGTAWGPATGSTFARLTTDNKYKAWSRGVPFNNNVYIWKGPSSDTTDDGVWVVENVLNLTDTNDIATAIANAYNLIPVSTMGVDADTWNTGDAVGIAAFSASENILPHDILVVSLNVDGGTILVFDLDNPTAGPVSFFGETNIMPPGAAANRLQLGKAGSYLFVLSGTDAASRELHRLNMVPEPSAILFGLGGLLLMLRKRG